MVTYYVTTEMDKFNSDNKLLINICRSFLAPNDIDVVVREPYIPYVPEKWNGILVLGEAQNLSKRYKGYVDKLKGMSEVQRFFRLTNPEDLAIMPWDNGSLKLAVESALRESASETAVSNAVLWSQTNNDGTSNKNPDKKLQIFASDFWSELLKILRPRHILASGNVAHIVIEQSRWTGRVTRIMHPSAMRFKKATANEKELLDKYPILATVIERHPKWVEKYRFLKIRFACHVIEAVRTNQIRIA